MDLAVAEQEVAEQEVAEVEVQDNIHSRNVVLVEVSKFR